MNAEDQPGVHDTLVKYGVWDKDFFEKQGDSWTIQVNSAANYMKREGIELATTAIPAGKVDDVANVLRLMRSAAKTKKLADSTKKSAKVFQEIVAFRAEKGLATVYTGDRAKDGVVAFLEINGKQYKGFNGWIGKTAKGKMESILKELEDAGVSGLNGRTPTHAEGHVFYQAVKEGTQGKRASIFVDSTFCESCGGTFFGLRPYAKALGIEELTVYLRYPNGHIMAGLYDLK